MASIRQIEANRRNALLSTGPSSAEGKGRVRSNALKHGLTAKEVVLQCESPDEFDEFHSALQDDLDPQGAREQFFVDKIIVDMWRLRRIPILEAAQYARGQQELVVRMIEKKTEEVKLGPCGRPLDLSDPEDIEPAEAELARESRKLKIPLFEVIRVLEEKSTTFANLTRHEQALSRAILRNLHELERLQAKRAGQFVPPPVTLDVNVDVSDQSASGRNA